MNTTKEQISDVIEALAEKFKHGLINLSADEIAAEWYWRWDETKDIAWNLYKFSDILELHKRRWRQWEEHHNGSCCVVERVRDKYVMPKIGEFLRCFSAHVK